MGIKSKKKTSLVALSVLAATPLTMGLTASPVQAATVITNGDIAYSAPTDDTPTPGSFEVDVYKVKTDGTGRTNLTADVSGNNYLPSYSPDGTQISYTADATGFSTVSRMNQDGTGKTDIAGDGSGPDSSVGQEWGPTNQVAFTRYNSVNTTRDLWKMNPNGTGQVNLTNNDPLNPVIPDRTVWTANGSKLYFNKSSDVDIYTINADGTGLALVNGVQGFPQGFSRNGLKALYLNGDSGQLFIANSDFSNPVQLFPCDFQNLAAGNVCVVAATFSPDSLKIASYAFRVVDPNDFSSWQVGIFTSNLDGSNLVQLTTESLSDFGSRQGVTWQAVIAVVPDPTPPTPGGSGSGSGTGTSSALTQAAVNPALDPVTELPKAGSGGMAGAYAGAVAVYGAYRVAKRKRWDIRRRNARSAQAVQ